MENNKIIEGGKAPFRGRLSSHHLWWWLLTTQRIDHLYQYPHIENKKIILHYGDLADTSNIIRIIQQMQPDEIYNLGAQSHVQVSFEVPEYTADDGEIGTLRILELEKKVRF